MKILNLAVAIGVAASGLVIATAPADAQGWHGHRHKVCRTVWVHHRKVRRCTWR